MSKTGEVVVREAVPMPVSQEGASLMKIIDRAAGDPAFDVAKLQALLDVKERWEKQEARKAYVSALAAFKANAPKIQKDKTVGFVSEKTGRTTSYKHATLDNASEQIGAALSTHGLSHRWNVEQDGSNIKVTCILTHVLGHSEQVSMHAQPDTSGSKNSIQAIGSTTSYLQRYTLFAATGLAPKDADNDGAGEPHVMAETAKEAYIKQIAALADKPSGEKLWKEIAAACQASGDIPTYDELKKEMAKKMKSLPATEEI